MWPKRKKRAVILIHLGDGAVLEVPADTSAEDIASLRRKFSKENPVETRGGAA